MNNSMKTKSSNNSVIKTNVTTSAKVGTVTVDVMGGNARKRTAYSVL